MVNRKIAPPVKDLVEFDLKLPVATRHQLANGVEVYALDLGTEDTLQLNWVFYAGNSYEEKKLVASATNYLLKNGTSTKNAFEINDHFDYYGSYVNRTTYNETSDISLHCLSKHLDELLPVVAEMISDSVFLEEELDIYKQNSKQRLKVGLQKGDFVAGRIIDAKLFGEQHPYGKYSNLEDYDQLTREDLLAFYEEYYKNGHCVIFIAGKLPENYLSKLDKNFGSLPLKNHRSAHPGPIHAVEPAADKKQTLIIDDQGVQAAIRIARHFPNRHHPDFQKVMVLNSVFGGFFGSRLMANIREEKGYTYGIYSYIMNHVHQSAWMISTEAGRHVSEATISEVYREMQELREEKIDEEELQVTKSYMIGTILGDLDGPFQVIGRWKNLVLNGLDDQYFYNGIKTIKSVTAEELQELAKKYLNPDDFWELVVI
ncbi:MAG: M16 family metallopeptidase [Flavitalea sp.]